MSKIKSKVKSKVIKAEAWQLGGGFERPIWLTNAIDSGVVVIAEDESSATITSIDGTFTVTAHSFIIRNSFGDIYCKRAEIFANEYEQDSE